MLVFHDLLEKSISYVVCFICEIFVTVTFVLAAAYLGQVSLEKEVLNLNGIFLVK